MFANDVCMNVLRIDAAVAPQQASEPSGVERGPGTEDTSGRHTTVGGEARSEVCHHVHGVAGDDEHGLWSMLQDRWHNLVKDLSVSLQQLKSRFPWLLSNPRTQ